MGKFKFKNKPNQKSNQQAPSNNDKKTSDKIFKFSPQVVGPKNNFATFATVKEKIIRRAQVELEQGHDIKVALESGKSPDFDNDKPHLKIIEIEEIMAEVMASIKMKQNFILQPENLQKKRKES